VQNFPRIQDRIDHLVALAAIHLRLLILLLPTQFFADLLARPSAWLRSANRSDYDDIDMLRQD
jgi:hypothetical protein